jgi:bifunctional non-homologous end joining protein LigD
MIAKNLNSTYRGIRTSEWQKIKCRRKDRGYVIGYTLLLNNDRAMGALVIGELQDGKMVHIGRVGTGFKAEDRLAWFKRLQPMEIDRHDVHNLRKEDVKGVRWVRPEIQIEFEMAERTNEGLLRQASFVGQVASRFR